MLGGMEIRAEEPAGDSPGDVQSLSAAMSATVDAPPDWDALQIEPACPLCAYNLRGLSAPRCPECGHRFEWRDLTDISRREHPYLFEHHPKRNWWSFWRTLWGGLLPGRFWRSLSPMQPSRGGRLAVYALLTMLPALLAAGIWWGSRTYQVKAEWERMQLRWVANLGLKGGQPPGIELFAQRALLSRGVYGVVVTAGLVAVWPVVNYLALLVFGQSMRRARVRKVHVARCLIYSHDATFWFGLAMMVVAGLSLVPTVTGSVVTSPLRASLLDSMPLYLLAGLVLVVWYRLWRSYQRYMGFDLAWATILASQVMVFLAAFTVFAFYAANRGGHF